MNRPRLVAAFLVLLPILPVGAAPTAAATPDTLTVAVSSIIDTLDPHMHYERSAILVNVNMFDSLLHRNARLQFEPSLATSWRAVSETVWEFKLRQGVKFHNGEVMTAEDVKFSIERVTEPGRARKRSPQYERFRTITDVRIVAPDTVQIVTSRPSPLFLERLVFFPIVPRKHVEKVGEPAFAETAAVGTGPWRLVEFKRGQHIRLAAFDEHWRGTPPFKRLVFRTMADVAEQVVELKAGRLDLIRNVPASLVPDLRAFPQTYVSSAPILRTHFVYFDMRVEPFNRTLVRQAANYAVDREAILRETMAGLGGVVATVVHPAAFGHDPSVTPYPYDPRKARELLAQAGYPNGVDITLHTAYLPFQRVFEAVARMLTEAGIRTTTRLWEEGPTWGRYFQEEGRATHGYYGSWGYYSVFDADAVLHPLYHTEPSAWIGKHYVRIDGLDQLIDRGRVTIDQAVRKQVYSEIQHRLKDEAASLFLFYQFETLAISRRIAYEARGDEWLWLFDARPRP